VPAHWTPAQLLAQEGIFFLKDVAGILELKSDKIKKASRALQTNGQNPYQVMGVRKVWNHWVVRMTVFREYYKAHLAPTVRPIRKEWNANQLLEQEGRFLLSDVCKLLPFKAHQLRYQSKNNPKTRREYGVWKDEKTGNFVVEMDRFSRWVKKLWRGGFR
jgi:hypothetical protein